MRLKVTLCFIYRKIKRVLVYLCFSRYNAPYPKYESYRRTVITQYNLTITKESIKDQMH